jgi:hypothetical protein
MPHRPFRHRLRRVKQLRLSPAEYEGSARLKEWVRKNKDQKYIPDDLLKLCGFEVKGDL